MLKKWKDCKKTLKILERKNNNVIRELTRKFMRFDYSGAPNIYFDWIINDMIREYEAHEESDFE